MWESTEKQFIYVRQKQGRNTHPERKGMGILSNEEEHSKEAVTSLIQGSSSGSLFTFGQLSCFFSHIWRVLGPSPTCMHIFLPRWIPAWRTVGGFKTLTMGWGPLPFDLQGVFLHMCSQGGLLDLRSGHLISLVQQSSAPATNFVLAMSRENKAPIYSTWQTPAAQPRAPSTSYHRTNLPQALQGLGSRKPALCSSHLSRSWACSQMVRVVPRKMGKDTVQSWGWVPICLLFSFGNHWRERKMPCACNKFSLSLSAFSFPMDKIGTLKQVS